MYAIFRNGGHQHRAEVGRTMLVERLPRHEVGDNVTFDVLLLGNGDQTLIGQPLVEGASVRATVVEHTRGPKIVVFKYRQRTNYRRRKGHRQPYTRLRIDEIALA